MPNVSSFAVDGVLKEREEKVMKTELNKINRKGKRNRMFFLQREVNLFYFLFKERIEIYNFLFRRQES